MSPGSALPGPLRLSPAFAFAGRARELATLRALMPRTVAEGRRAALVAGEPGSGKSRLVRELAHELSAEGATVLYGDCDAVVGSPYAPFVAALSPLVRGRSASLVEAVGPASAELVRLVPELASELGESLRSASSDPDTERLRLHTAVMELLVRASSEAPLLLLLEDVHWADTSTLLLMRHLVRTGAGARMLIVATFRDTETGVSAGELSDVLVDVYRTEGVARIRLGGLTDEELAEFVRLAAGVEPTADLIAVVRELTDGNAFLVTELWRDFVESGAVEVGPNGVSLARPAAELGTPTTVREVVNQRVLRLAADTADMLELAAVAGADFELATLRRASVLSEAALLDAIDESVVAGLVIEQPGRGLAYRFAHELVRRAIVDRLSSAREAELHLRVAEALEQAGAPSESWAHLSALAHHFAAAAPLGAVERAVEYNLRAADSAVEALSYDEAAARFRTALELGLDDEPRRAAVTLDLGDAFRRGGRAEQALAAYAETVEHARRLGDHDLFARAAIGFEEACWRPAIHDGESVRLLEEAAIVLGTEDSALRALVLGGLARAHDLRGESEPAAKARDESIAMSRRLGDRLSLARTLAAAYWSRGVSSNEEVEEMLQESRRLAAELGDLEVRGDATAWLVPISVVLCDHDAAREALAELLSISRQISQPFLHHVATHYEAALALCDGDLAAAEAAAVRSYEWGRFLTGGDASGLYGVQMFSIRREQGRVGELAPVVRMLDGGALDDAWRPGVVALLAELGMEDEARRRLRAILDEGLGSFRPSLWIASLVYLADACAALGDVDAAEALYAELSVHAGTNAMVGHLVTCYGAMDRYLGSMAALRGDWDSAEEHFHAALALNTRLGARTWLAHTSYAYARMLLARGARGDAPEARGQLGLTLGLARAIGMPELARRAASLGADEAASVALPDGLTAREVEILQELARGASNREIGRTLHISEHTAANHVRSILRKTRSANRTEAAGYALRRGLVPE
jgi:DNA-binding CsgD family transcriptional regulator